MEKTNLNLNGFLTALVQMEKFYVAFLPAHLSEAI